MDRGPATTNGFARHALVTLCLAGATVSPVLAGGAPPCESWQVVPTPSPGDHVNRLTSVSALGPNDAWAVGHWRNDPVGAGPIAAHWDGASWSLASLPDTSSLGTDPEIVGVEMAANGDVWIVGSVSTPYPTYSMALALRRRGGAWDVVQTVELRPQTVYPYAARGGRFFEAHALSADDVWAVGQATGFGDGGATSVPLAAHWDGESWTEIDVPVVANRHHELNDVFAIAPDDVWAVGDYRNVAAAFHGVTYHWDGSSWTHVPSPIEAINDSGIEDVVATGPNDVWAIGSSAGGVHVMHWDGSSWSMMPAPANYGGSLAAVAPNDLWASGWNGFWHWNGSDWSAVASGVPNMSYVIRNGGMEIVDDCDIWCVGFATLADGITSFTLAERLGGAASLPGDVDGDGVVGFGDLLALLADWGPCVGCPADLDGSGTVDFADLLIVLTSWS